MQYLRKSKRHKTRKQTVSFSLLRPGGQLLNNGRLVLKKNPVFSAWTSTLNKDLINKG